MQASYLDKVCSLIRFREARPQVRRELENHFDDIVQEFLAQGMNDSDAVRIAIERMGDPKELGQQLDQAHRPQFDWGLFLISSALVVVGLIVLYSIQSTGLLPGAEPVFSRTLLFTSVGVLLVTGLFYFDYYDLRGYAVRAFWAILGWGAAFMAFATYDEQARRVLAIGTVSFDFIAITPFLFMITLAGIFSQAYWTWSRKDFYKAMLLLALPNMYYLLISESNTAMALYTCAFLMLAWYSGAGWKKVLCLAGGIVIALCLAVLFLEPYRMETLLGFWNPQANADGAGYIYLQLQNTIQNINLWGHGAVLPPGVPEFYTDLVYVYILYCFGWLAGILLASLAFLLIIRLLRSVGEIKEPFGQLLVLGVATLFFVQFGWSILMALGAVPFVPMSMPFISYGGNSYLNQMLMLGLVLSVYRRRNLERGEICS